MEEFKTKVAVFWSRLYMLGFHKELLPVEFQFWRGLWYNKNCKGNGCLPGGDIEGDIDIGLRMVLRESKTFYRLSFAVFLVVIFILWMGYRAFRNTEISAYHEFNRRQMVIANGVAAGITTYFQHLAGELRTVLPRLLEQPGDGAGLATEINFLFDELKPWGINDIGLLDEKGILKRNAGAPHLIGKDFSWRQYFKEAKQTALNRGSRQVYIIEFIDFKGADVGQKGVLVAVPAVRNGTFKGVVLCTVKLFYLTKRYVAAVKSAQRGHALLLDEKTNVLWSPDLSLFGKNLLEQAAKSPGLKSLAKMLVGRKADMGEYVYRKFDESLGRCVDEPEEKLIALAPVRLGKEQWTIGIWAPKSCAMRSIRSVYYAQLAVVGMSIAIIMVVYFILLSMTLRAGQKLELEVNKKTGQLKESQERLLTILNNLKASVYAADMETHEILFANKHLRDRYGDIEGKLCWQVFHKDSRGPCEFCTNRELLSEEMSEEIDTAERNVREFRTTLSGLWYERREQAVRWMDGRLVRLEIAMDTPCEAPGKKR